MVSYLPDGRTMKFNLASQAGRTAGSAFKPFTLAAAIDQGISVSTGLSGPSQLTITDPKCAFNGVPWDVHNYADESGGYMNLLDATAHSVNTIYAQLVDIVGPANVVSEAHKLGITSPSAAGLLDHARHAGRQPARDDERVRDARRARRPSRPAGVRGRARHRTAA